MYKSMKIYFLKSTGDVVWSVSYDRSKNVDLDNDYEISTTLQQYTKSSLDVLVLTGGQYAQDFAECTSYRVNPETRQLEFSYEPVDEGEQPVYRAPLSEEVTALRQENTLLNAKVDALANHNELIEGALVELTSMILE